MKRKILVALLCFIAGFAVLLSGSLSYFSDREVDKSETQANGFMASIVAKETTKNVSMSKRDYNIINVETWTDSALSAKVNYEFSVSPSSYADYIKIYKYDAAKPYLDNSKDPSSYNIFSYTSFEGPILDGYCPTWNYTSPSTDISTYTAQIDSASGFNGTPVYDVIDNFAIFCKTAPSKTQAIQIDLTVTVTPYRSSSNPVSEKYTYYYTIGPKPTYDNIDPNITSESDPSTIPPSYTVLYTYTGDNPSGVLVYGDNDNPKSRIKVLGENNSIISCKVPSSVEGLEVGSFSNFNNLVSVKFENNNKIKEIPEYTFRNCASLKSVDLSVLYNLNTIAPEAFYGCPSLESVYLPFIDFNIDYTTIFDGNPTLYIGSEAYNVYKQVIITNVPEYETELNYGTASSISYEYSNSEYNRDNSTGTLDLSKTPYTSITRDGLSYLNNQKPISAITFPAGIRQINDVSLLSDLTQLEELDLSYTQITDLSFLTQYPICLNLKTLRLPATITNINQLNNCNNLEVIDMSKADNLTDFSRLGSFSNLKEVKFPSNLQMLNSSTFSGLRNLDTLDLSNLSPTTINSDAFRNLNVQTLILPKGITSLNGFSFSSNIVTLDMSHTKIETIPSQTFSNMSMLEEVIFPSTLSLVESRAFYNCTTLKVIDFVGTRVLTENSDFYSDSFYQCRNLSSVFFYTEDLSINEYSYQELFENATVYVFNYYHLV